MLSSHFELLLSRLERRLDQGIPCTKDVRLRHRLPQKRVRLDEKWVWLGDTMWLEGFELRDQRF
jgi:hypothetical protein